MRPLDLRTRDPASRSEIKEGGCVASQGTNVVANHMGGGEMEKVMHSFPHDRQWLFPAFASAA
jgi:hypothetical protein